MNLDEIGNLFLHFERLQNGRKLKIFGCLIQTTSRLKSDILSSISLLGERLL